MSKPFRLSPGILGLILVNVVIAVWLVVKPGQAAQNKFQTAQYRYVVFTSTRDGNYEIYAADPEDPYPIRLTDHPEDDYNPSISPDGRKVAFTSRRDGDYEIYVMNLDGSDQTRITYSPGGDDFPAWSPDGTRIAFTSWRDGNSEIYVMNADGSSQVNITNDPQDDVFPAWSPAGDRIAFASSRADEPRLEPVLKVYTMDSDGGNPKLLIDTESRWPEWSPDGSKIAFVAYSGGPGGGVLQVYDLTWRTIKPLHIPASIDGKVAWSPDGTEILVNTYWDNAHGELCWVSAIGLDGISCLTSDGAYDGNADW